MKIREFQFSEGTSNKFWRIEVKDNAFTVVYGRVGTGGQTQTKEFDSNAEATKAADKLISEKVKKGYAEVTAAGTAAATTTPSSSTATPTSKKKAESKPAPGEETPAPLVETAPEPVAPAVAMPADGSFRRELLFDAEKFLLPECNQRKPQPKPEIRPFDFQNCVTRFNKFWKSADYAHGRKSALLGIDWTMSPEEARFWFELLSSPEANQSIHGQPDVSAARDAMEAPLVSWSEFLANRVDPFFKHNVFTASIFFKLFPLEDLIGSCSVHGSHYLNYLTNLLSSGFRLNVLPNLTEDELETFKVGLPRIIAKTPFPKDYYEGPALCFYLAGYFGLADELKPVVEGIPDDTYSKDKSWDHTHYHRPQEIVFALRDPKLVEHHFRRLKLPIHEGFYLFSWLAITRFDALDYLENSLLGVTKKDEAAKLVQTFAESIVGPEVAPVMLRLMLESKAPRQAREWLEKNPVETIVGLIPVAAGRGKLADAAIDFLRGLKRRGYAEVIAAFADKSPADVKEKVRALVVDYVEKQYAAFTPDTTPAWLALAESGKKAAKLPGWLELAALPPLTVGEFKLNDAQVTTLLGVLQGVKAASIRDSLTHPHIAGIREHVEPLVRDHFGWKLFEGWQADGAASKEGWAFLALGLLGHDAAALKLAPLVRAWPGESQHARAVTGLDVLRAIGTDTALMQINGIAQKVKFKGLKTKAQECMEAIASDRGMTRAELEDRIVPDCDLDERGGRTFDFGPRQFRMLLGNDLKPAIREADGKIKPDLPKPNAKDDSTLSAQAVAEWKLLKKQVAEVAKIQAVRLEQAMVTGRRWPAETFELLIVRHPLMTNLAQKLVWATYDGAGKVTSTFRVSEDRSYSDAEDGPYSLDAAASVGVVHPLHLGEDDRARWGELFGDYEIIPPFPQLGRTLFALEGKEGAQKMITRFDAIKIPPQALVFTLEKLGWERGIPQDGGCFFSHTKPFYGANVTAVVEYEGVPVGYMDGWDDQKMEKCFFLKGIRTPQSYPHYEEKNALKLSDIDPVAISETLSDLTFVASKGK